MAIDVVPVKTALISVYSKEGVAEFCGELAKKGAQILSTGGTAKLLKEKGVPVRDVSDYTGFPELFEGRVKTLHPLIHGGILYRRGNKEDEEAAKKAGIRPIDLVCVNLYPLGGEIDIGGPAMIRAAAKNHESVAVVTDPADYATVLKEVGEKGGTTLATRKMLARKAFELTSSYDSVVAGSFGPAIELFPTNLTLGFQKAQALRYGENPHQQAAFYSPDGKLPGVKQLGGKELSYNNILDTDAALGIVREFTEPVAVILKHANPCGVATGKTIAEAFNKAYATDTVSPFGGIIAFNRTVDAAAAEAIGDKFIEIVAAPAFEPAAVENLMKKKSRRLLDVKEFLANPLKPVLFRSALGGILAQSPDTGVDEKLETVTKKKPSEAEFNAALFGWKIAKHVKSNAIVFSLEDRTIGIGAGQMSRVDSCRIAVEKAKNAGLDVKGTAMASDAFFPFRDSVDFAAQAGATTAIQPGGSIRDAEVIAAADEHGLSMIFTHARHFRH